MEIGILINICSSLFCCCVCPGISIFFFVLLIGVIVLRKRGQKKVTVKEALEAGKERVSEVFVRNADGGIGGIDDDDDDDDSSGDA